jgi:hypothetical protein
MKTLRSFVHDFPEFSVGPVTVEDRARKEITGEMDMFEYEVLYDDDGTEIGMEETCREVYYGMRARYCRGELDQIEYLIDSHFTLNYDL